MEVNRYSMHEAQRLALEKKKELTFYDVENPDAPKLRVSTSCQVYVLKKGEEPREISAATIVEAEITGIQLAILQNDAQRIEDLEAIIQAVQDYGKTAAKISKTVLLRILKGEKVGYAMSATAVADTDKKEPAKPETVRIDTDGPVGGGTTSPDTRVEVPTTKVDDSDPIESKENPVNDEETVAAGTTGPDDGEDPFKGIQY